VESVESMDISALVLPSTVAVRAGVTTKRQLMNLLAELASPTLGASEKVLVEALMEREALGSTGLQGGAAVPHARCPDISKIVGVFVKLEQPLEFDALDERPVDLVFALFAPAEAGAEHLRALAAVSRLLRRAEVREQLRRAKTPEALYALLVHRIEASAAA